MSDPITQFIGAISAAGITPPKIVLSDGKLHRFASNGDARDKAGWYIFHLDGIPAGAFGDFRSDLSSTWRADIDRKISPQELADCKARVEAMRRQREAEAAKVKAEARKEAVAIWGAGLAAPTDHPYLTKKGVKPHGLRVHEGRLVVPMLDDQGTLHSLHFIAADGSKRFLTGGRVAGCFYQIGEPRGVICVGEGFATMATVHEATGHAADAAINKSSLLAVAQSFRRRFPAAKIVLCADDDWKVEGNPGLTDARAAAAAVGGVVAVPEFGEGRSQKDTDFNDIARVAGKGAVSGILEKALGDDAHQGIADQVNEAIERGEKAGLTNSAKPRVQLSADLYADLSNCERLLINSTLVEVYQRAGCIVRRGTAKGKNHAGEVVTFDRVARHNVNSLLSVMAQAITFLSPGKIADERHPPREYSRLLLDRPEKDYPVLRGLISAPTLRADGSILNRPGYDEQTGLFFDNRGVDFGAIPASPTKDGALAALQVLIEPIAKFPFVDEASKSVQLARMLTGVCRTALPTAPLFGYTAPAARTGKSMLVDIACVLSHGHAAPVVAASSAIEELDKQLQAMVSSGDTIIALDNQDADEALASNLLCQMLTQPVIKIRPFGQNQDMLDFPSLSVVSVTGNNLAIAKDMTERTILCSLDAKMEIPGSRKFNFNPVAMALENRAQLVRSCLTILKAYVVAGRPPQKITSMGGFENWSDLVRSSLVWLGAEDPCATMNKIRASDQSRDLQITIMDLWAERFGKAEMSAGDAVKAAQAGAEDNSDLLTAFWCTAKKGAKNLPMALGKWLNSKDGVVIGSRRFEASGRQGHLKFSLHSIEEPTA